MQKTSDWDHRQLTGLSQSHLTILSLSEREVLVHKDVESALLSLVALAKKAGFEVAIASGYRDFARQRMIWNNKYLGLRPILSSDGQVLDAKSLSIEERIHAILRWSALPGASRHHWGCDFDLYAHNLLPSDTKLQLEPWEYLEGHQAPFYQWLLSNAQQLGFFFPYSKDKGGVAIEPWHLSHQQTSNLALEQLTQSMLAETLEQNPIEGSREVLKHLNSIYTQYVTNISTT
ncbi:M15 family metallopeptidase [Vibrio breoganii]|uniref:Peptidase M15 n=1 Tax=Vibrio breoganii TaxID=553239 RepID=A0AAN1CSC2_9VIBR|nr:M15 family metallopeptidase [Vibrio breoganii]ANO33438.1 peptidase M15 [Vibrio breoganii]OED85290.1 peptidase M15 [Vibrio breoganii ZF-55]PMK47042.1 peptidase M15 [Vibrio breoganii]PML41902.1 peptidase M15 [Vibrio breoganii]PMO73881.1 peptidase M15 [Vibrio breoganii]